MRERLSQTSATFSFPDPGELDKRVELRQRIDVPASDFGVEPEYHHVRKVWAKVRQVGAGTYQSSVQSDYIITHYITIRYRPGITSDFEIVMSGQVYRIKRSRDLNSARRFLLMECEELGAVQRGGPSYG